MPDNRPKVEHAGRRRRRRRPGPVVAPPRSARSVLAELADDPGYLAFKASLGEPLTPSERARLDAARTDGPDRAGRPS